MAQPYDEEDERDPDAENGGSGTGEAGGGGSEAVSIRNAAVPQNPTNIDPNSYAFDLPAGYKDRSLQLSGEAAKHEDQAMELLRQALKKPEISASQGIAAALLAAIPTFGGYLIGKANGGLNLPEGSFGVSKDVMQEAQPGFAGAEGAKLGDDTAQGYLKSLDRTKENTPILEKMSEIESNRATRLNTNADSLVNQGLEQKAREASDTRRIGLETQKGKELINYKHSVDDAALTPDVQAALKQKLIASGVSETSAEAIVSDPTALKHFENLSRLDLGQSNNNNIERRAEEKRNDHLSEQDTGPASKPIVNPKTGQPVILNNEEKKNVIALDMNVPTILRNVDKLRDSIAQDGRLTLGDPRSAQSQYASQIINRLRGFDAQGIRFNEFLKKVDETQLGVALLSDNPSGALSQVLQGQDADAALTRFGNEVAQQHKERLLANRHVPDPAALMQYDPDNARTLAKYLNVPLPTDNAQGGAGSVDKSSDAYQSIYQQKLAEARQRRGLQ